MSQIHTLCLTRGQDIMVVLYEYLKDKAWPAALILSGIGSVRSITFGNPLDLGMPPKMVMKTIDEPAEVISFNGEIIRKENAPADMPAYVFDSPCDYVVHIHASVSHGGGIVEGGGFRAGVIMRALNIYIQELT